VRAYPAMLGLLAVAVPGTRAARAPSNIRGGPSTGEHTPAGSPPANIRDSQQRQATRTSPPLDREGEQRLGPFPVGAGNYTVVLRTKKVLSSSSREGRDTVVAMEIRDAKGATAYRRTFPYHEADGDFSDAWSVSADLLAGTNGTGLLLEYDADSEVSVAKQEPTEWFHVFGILHGKLAPFGAPFALQGGQLSDYLTAKTYRAARPLGSQADTVEFKVWTGHGRLVFPLGVDWNSGKVAPVQDCAKTVSGELNSGCQYKAVPEDGREIGDLTFVRLWLNPDEKSGQPKNTLVKQDSKVELLVALAETRWVEGTAADPSQDSKDPMKDAGSFGVVPHGDLWLKVRIDGNEGWTHTDEDFRALGLPEDE
jgi:hypothetical protein